MPISGYKYAQGYASDRCAWVVGIATGGVAIRVVGKKGFEHAACAPNAPNDRPLRRDRCTSAISAPHSPVLLAAGVSQYT